MSRLTHFINKAKRVTNDRNVSYNQRLNYLLDYVNRCTMLSHELVSELERAEAINIIFDCYEETLKGMCNNHAVKPYREFCSDRGMASGLNQNAISEDWNRQAYKKVIPHLNVDNEIHTLMVETLRERPLEDTLAFDKNLNTSQMD